MRVLMLGWEFPPHVSGGLGTACFGLTRGLSQAGVDVVFVLPHARGDEDQRFARVLGTASRRPAAFVGAAPARTAAAKTSAAFEQRRIDSPLRPYQTAGDYAAGDFDSNYGADLYGEVERFGAAVARVAQSERFDCVHAHDWMTFGAGALAARAAGCPLICHVHATELDRNPNAPDARISDFEREGLAAADRVVCVSRFTADRVAAEYGVERARLRVVHNGVAGARAAACEARPVSAEPHVLFLGRMTAQKAPGTFLEAAARVAQRDASVHFELAGDGAERPRLEARAAELALGDRIQFSGFLVGRSVARAYRSADVFVLPSVSEPFGITPLEALCHGVPVIVPRHSGVAEVLHGALVFDPGNVDELAEKILALLRFPALREQCLAASRDDLAHLSWEERARELVGVYMELVA